MDWRVYMYLLKAEKVTKSYQKSVMNKLRGEKPINVLVDIDIQIKSQDFVAIMGKSGCGKTTLLKILGTIEKPSSGNIEYYEENINTYGNEQLSALRRKKIGFVFQDFRLLDSLTVKENIQLPLVLDQKKTNERLINEKAELLEIIHILDKYPYNLSGGEKQRVAILRALINNPDIIFADEPTGNLDSLSTEKVMESFKQINEVYKKTLILVTHDYEIACNCNKTIFMKDGRIMNQIDMVTNSSYRESIKKAVFLNT